MSSTPLVFNLDTEWQQTAQASEATIKTLSQADITGKHALFFVKTTDMRRTFKFQVDSVQIDAAAHGLNDGTSPDVMFTTSNTNWHDPAAGANSGLVNLNAAHANMGQGVVDWLALSANSDVNNTTTVTPESNASLAGTLYPENRMLLKHDYMRYLSNSLFNTPHFVDQFNNENSVMEGLATDLSATYKTIIYDKLTAQSAAPIEFNDQVTTDYTDNLGQKLYETLLGEKPERFYLNGTENGTINGVTNNNIAEKDVDGASNVANIDEVRPLPILDGDSFEFSVTINAATGQESTPGVKNGVQVVPAYTRVIKVVCVDDASALTLNIQPSDRQTDGDVSQGQTVDDESPFNTHAPYKS